jgi:hypothetical protein
MRSIRRVVPSAVALSLGLGIVTAGCGGDDSSNQDALTRAELTAKATAICAPVTQTVNGALGKVFSEPKPDPQAFAAAIDSTVIPQFSRQTDALAELQPPSELQDRYASYLDSARQVLTEMKNDPSAPFTGNPVQFYGPSNAKAKDAGLPDVCLAGPQGG